MCYIKIDLSCPIQRIYLKCRLSRMQRLTLGSEKRVTYWMPSHFSSFPRTVGKIFVSTKDSGNEAIDKALPIIYTPVVNVSLSPFHTFIGYVKLTLFHIYACKFNYYITPLIYSTILFLFHRSTFPKHCVTVLSSYASSVSILFFSHGNSLSLCLPRLSSSPFLVMSVFLVS